MLKAPRNKGKAAFGAEYAVALGLHVNANGSSSVKRARRIQRQAVLLQMDILDLARIHEQAMITQWPLEGKTPGPADKLKRAQLFFISIVLPVVRPKASNDLRGTAHHVGLRNTLGERTTELKASKRFLNAGISRRKSAEQALKRHCKHYARLYAKARRLSDQLQALVRRNILSQEAERTEFSRALNNGVSQSLLEINMKLHTLAEACDSDTAGLLEEYDATERIVKASIVAMQRLERRFKEKEPR